MSLKHNNLNLFVILFGYFWKLITDKNKLKCEILITYRYSKLF